MSKAILMCAALAGCVDSPAKDARDPRTRSTCDSSFESNFPGTTDAVCQLACDTQHPGTENACSGSFTTPNDVYMVQCSAPFIFKDGVVGCCARNPNPLTPTDDIAMYFVECR